MSILAPLESKISKIQKTAKNLKKFSNIFVFIFFLFFSSNFSSKSVFQFAYFIMAVEYTAPFITSRQKKTTII